MQMKERILKLSCKKAGRDMKKFSLGACVALCAVTAAVTVSLTYMYAMDTFNERVADVNQRQAMYSKLSEIDQTIRQNFVGEIDETALTDGICTGYLAGLGDADAKYLTAEQYKAYVAGTSGSAVGTGISTVKDTDGNMEVTEVAPGSPAEAAGMKKGDVIISIDDKEVVRITYAAAVSLLEGEEGSVVNFKVLRPAEKDGEQSQVVTISVTRAEYNQNSVQSSVICGNVGYIRISRFRENTPDQFREAMKELENQKVCGLVLDLRSNSGGDMEAAASVMDMLLPAGTVVASRDSAGKETVEFTSAAGETALPVSVVMDENTYGAAELVAANVRDYKKGLLVGQQTAGHGRKSQVVPLSDGSAVFFPIAEYLTLNGQVFDGAGIAPDITKVLSDEQSALFLSGSLKEEEDAQILSAVTALARQGAQVEKLPGGEEVTDGEKDASDASQAESKAEEEKSQSSKAESSASSEE
jgi:carboxyl-terminal processing protease